ncbi:MAG TPA: hypothetical protein VGZ00_08865 [Candidatus Baltobacteraceae bacterium]|jgi:DNA-binding beta-propeller fold protein YncE|nr:hypothetical protein [Candidatus Baltobacteraceae bacterium]
MTILRFLGVIIGLVVLAVAPSPAAQTTVPSFIVDPSWPKPLPNNWILGQVSGIAVDAQDHIWVLHRPDTLTVDERGATLTPPLSKCCVPAPSVLEFDTAGNLLRAWGGPGRGYDWPKNEHGLSIDSKGFVWIGSNGKEDGEILKFTPEGKFILQIGRPGPLTNSDDITRLGRPAGISVDTSKNEVYVADGYHNHRVIVFDSETGAYKRRWGAYGTAPRDIGEVVLEHGAPPPSPPPAQFGNPVHCVHISHDGLVYVCDRINDRIQVFREDGTFVKEFVIEPKTAGNGSVWDIAFSNDREQRFLYVADGRNNEIHILLRDTGEQLTSFGHSGRSAGQFHWVHDLAVDSKGNIYTGEVDTGKRTQKFVRQ